MRNILRRRPTTPRSLTAEERVIIARVARSEAKNAVQAVLEEQGIAFNADGSVHLLTAQEMGERTQERALQCPCQRWAANFMTASWVGVAHHPDCDGRGQRKGVRS